MATPGVQFQLTDADKTHAIKYVEESGLYKTRLADFLGISRPTLDKALDDDPDFFTALKRADAVFCKTLVDAVAKKNPIFILRTKYREEFNDMLKVGFDPEVEIQRVKMLIEAHTTKEIAHLESE